MKVLKLKGQFWSLYWLWGIPFLLSVFIKPSDKNKVIIPITPSSTILSIRVNQDSDDAEQGGDNNVDTGSSDLELGEDGSDDQICGMRFRGINVPKGAVINSAYIEFYADGSHTDAINLDIYGEAIGTAAGFSENPNNISNRDTTFARVHWDNIESWTDNALYATPDISAIIQEIVNRSDWTALNDMAILIEMDGTSGTRRAESHDGAASVAPLLVIDYEPATAMTYTYDNTQTATLSNQADCNTTLSKIISVPDSFFIEDLRVGLNVEHTYRGDLQVQITSPSGTTLNLINQKNDPSDHYDLMLADASANAINDNNNDDISTPIYQNDRLAVPDNPLSIFDGELAKGNWTLTFCNVDQGSSGGRGLTFNSARLMFEGSPSLTCVLTEVAITTTCNNKGTTVFNDDYYTITINPEGYKIGTTYNVAGNYNGINFAANNLPYGSPQTLAVQVPIGTRTDLTITDVDSTTCSISTQILSPSECSSIFTCWAISDEGNPDVLFRYDSDVNTWTEIGATGVNGIESLAYDPFSDKIYTADYDLIGNINLTTGAFTAIGTDIGSLDGVNGSHDIADIDGLSFDPFSGIIWATERRGGDVDHDYLFQIDTATGNFIPDAFGTGIDYVIVPQIYDPVNAQFVYDVDDIAIDPETGDLYAICNQGGTGGVLTILNKADGTIKEVIGNFGEVDDMEALGFYNNGFLYGSTGNNSPDPLDLNRFFIIDKSDASLVERAKIDVTNSEKDFEACDCLTGGFNTISGLIFNDINGNGQFTMNEIGLGGVSVNLYRDIDGDSVFTENVDVLLTTTTTEADGTYNFSIASTGEFLITIDTMGLPTESGLTTDNRESAQFIGTGLSNENNDFGYILLTYDFGDLPDVAAGTTGINDYETAEANNGPSHLIVSGLFLGDTVDIDNDGFPDIAALGDDNDNVDDEDGITILSSLDARLGSTIRLPLSGTNTTGDTAYLAAWIDWNGDGDFDITNELVTEINDNTDGVFPAYLTIAIPSTATTGSLLGFRIRLSNTNDMTPYGRVNSGEVEDYLLGVECEQICLSIEVMMKRE